MSWARGHDVDPFPIITTYYREFNKIYSAIYLFHTRIILVRYGFLI